MANNKKKLVGVKQTRWDVVKRDALLGAKIGAGLGTIATMPYIATKAAAGQLGATPIGKAATVAGLVGGGAAYGAANWGAAGGVVGAVRNYDPNYVKPHLRNGKPVVGFKRKKKN